MPHRLILRAAIGLTLLLVLASLAFAFATSVRERRLTSAAATTPASPSAYDAKSAAASFETRCAKCHEMDEMQDWLKDNAGAGQSDQLLAFLKAHKKAPDPENEAITRFLSESKAPKP